jgi:hypothetical protein
VPFNTDGTPAWPPSGSGWSGPLPPLDLGDLPGRGDFQAHDTLMLGNGSGFIQGFWRSNQGWWRVVYFKADGIPNWPPDRIGWHGPLPLDENAPGWGDMQAQDALVYADGSKVVQTVWRGNQGFRRVVPFGIAGWPDWCGVTRWLPVPPLNEFPGSGELQAYGTLVCLPRDEPPRP